MEREIFFKKKKKKIKTIQKNFWGHVAGSKMLIPTPLIIQEYINHIESGKISEVETMRNDLAIEYGVHFRFYLPNDYWNFFENSG